jgi:hypothetical protein
MPFIFLVAGLVMVTAGVRGTSQQIVTLLEGDLRGKNNFIYWILSIAVVGGLGYIQDFRSFSRALLVLILIVLVLAENKQQGGGGLFAQFQSSVKTITGG